MKAEGQKGGAQFLYELLIIPLSMRQEDTVAPPTAPFAEDTVAELRAALEAAHVALNEQTAELAAAQRDLATRNAAVMQVGWSGT